MALRVRQQIAALVLAGLLLPALADQRNAVAPAVSRKVVRLASIEFEVLKHPSSRRRYLLIHGSEQTAREVLTAHMQSQPGIAYLVTGTERYVAVDSGRFDPNRVFSPVGAEKNLRMLNPGWSAAQLQAVLRRLDRERKKLIRTLLPPRRGLLIALHNNSQGYSVKDEIGISGAVSLKDPEHPHEFMLCTDRGDFSRLAGSPFNVVLQNRALGEDDGSFSRLAARRGARYVNIEASLGNADAQRRMLAWVESSLP